MRSFGLLCLVAAWAMVAACGSDATQPKGTAVVPVDSDPRPTSTSPLIPTFHYVNDSTMSVEYTVSDTVPFDTVYIGVESATIKDTVPTMGSPYAFGPIFEVKKHVFTPPRYTVHATDTLPSRGPGRNWLWAMIVRKTNGRYSEGRSAREYFGPRAFSLEATGVPPQTLQQPGLELVVRSWGAAPLRALRVYVDSGTSRELAYGPTPLDSAKFASVGPDLLWHVWVTGPLANGKHVLTVSGRDSLGRRTSSTQPIDVAMPTPAYRVLPITAPGAIDTRAEGLNTAGVVVGTYRTPDSVQHALRWINGRYETLPGNGPSRAGLVNDGGVVVGLQRTGTADSLVSWRDSSRIALAPSRLDATLSAIDDAGNVLYDLFFVYARGKVTRSPIFYTFGMNNSGTLVGDDNVDVRQNTAVAFDGTKYSVSPPYAPAFVDSRYCGSVVGYVNDRNQMIGTTGCSPAAFLAEKGKSPYWLVNWFGTGTVYAMSRWTLVLGRLTDGTIAVWQIGGVVSLPALDSSDWIIDELKGINENGQIIAHGVNKVTNRKAALLLDPL